MRGSVVAKRYANALLEVGIAHKKLDLIQTQVNDLSAVFEASIELRNVISNPVVRVAERHAIVNAVADKKGWDVFVKNFALILVDNKRFAAVPDIAYALNDLIDAHRGDLRATVTTARPLKDSQAATVQGALAKMTGKNIILETKIDEALIGGIVTRIGNKVYDGSVRTKLASLKESILKDV